jgi:hypothetical protein
MNTQITQEQIDAWKAKHKDIFKITIEDKAAYLKKPDRKVLAAATAASTTNPMKFNEVVLTNCWLGGDEEIKTEDSYFLGASAKLNEIIEVKQAELEKL